MSKGILSWGKPRIIVQKDEEGAIYRELNTPVDDSTNLETTEGDKTEAKIEGGEIEAVRYDKSTYKLALQIRLKADDKMPFENKDGVVSGVYKVWVKPEDAAAYGFHMAQAHVSVKTSFTANDGILVNVAFDALSTGGSVAQCQFGMVNITEADGNISGITFEDVLAESEIQTA